MGGKISVGVGLMGQIFAEGELQGRTAGRLGDSSLPMKKNEII
jgi:hypothetical protein